MVNGGQMNIDERIEALTHSVELLASLHQDNEKQMRRLGRYIRSVSQMVLDHEARLRAVEGNGGEVDEG
jgi:hypothetical protein